MPIAIHPTAWKVNSRKARCRMLHSPIPWCQKRSIAPVPRIEVNSASCGAARIYIVVKKGRRLHSGFIGMLSLEAYRDVYGELVYPKDDRSQHTLAANA